MRFSLTLAGVLALAGCAGFNSGRVPDSLPEADPAVAAAISAPPSRPELAAPPPAVGAVTVEALDTTTPEQRAAAVNVSDPVAETGLGSVSVALGNPTEAGFWLQSALVKAPAAGRVTVPGGASVKVDLRPGTGAALLSLAAYRALGLSLTDVPTVAVFSE